ncbi:MAG: lipopolysaccharide biosynthesis protein, partial [Moraxellaceae bacterium]
MTLKKQLGRSTAWMSAAATGNSVASFIIFIVLSRLLEPKDIGLVAFALIIVEIGKIIVNAGFPQAIVKHPVWDETFASTCFYLNMVFAISVTLLIFFVGSPLVGRFYEVEAIPILQVLSIIFFIDGIKAVHEGKLKREFNFKVIALRTIFAGVISGMIGIFMAIKGFGVWALVGQQLINQCIITLFTLTSARWTPKWKFSTSDSKSLLRFSSPLMLGQLINNVNSKIFEILIGILVGAAALGFYRVGGRALFILQEIVIKPFDYTLLSAISRINEKAAQAQATLRVIRMSAYVTFPIFFGAAAIGPEFIIFAFGEKWALSGQVMT